MTKFRNRAHFEEELIKSVQADLKKSGGYTVRHHGSLAQPNKEGEHEHRWKVFHGGKQVGLAYSTGESKTEPGQMEEFDGDELHDNEDSHQHIQSAIDHHDKALNSEN